VSERRDLSHSHCNKRVRSLHSSYSSHAFAWPSMCYARVGVRCVAPAELDSVSHSLSFSCSLTHTLFLSPTNTHKRTLLRQTQYTLIASTARNVELALLAARFVCVFDPFVRKLLIARLSFLSPERVKDQSSSIHTH